MTETPLIVIWGQRPGPSTGLPTRTAQGDLQFALHASQGEFPRIVLAPGDIDECFHAAYEAFNLAERWQLPVIILVDKHVCECYKSTTPFDTHNLKIDRGQFANAGSGEFPRYKITENGVSPRALPGQPGGIFRAVSDEHDESGYLTEEPTTCKAMNDKRMRKLEYIARELPEPVLYGPAKAGVTIIGWGSTKGSILDALPLLQAKGIAANFLQVYYMWPFPAGTLGRTIDTARAAVCIEQNATGQLALLIREQTGKAVDSLLKYDGRQWTPEQVASAVENRVKGV
jgi:2-oxoglutarate ferredoxin oxidoreductase subunit alpha